MRYLIFLLSLGLIGWFIYARWEDLSHLPHYLQLVSADSIAILLTLELVFLMLAAESNRLVYRSIGVKNRLFDQLQLLVAAGTIERFLPSGGAAGMSSYVLLARHLGISVADSIKMTATTFVLGYAQIVPLLLIPFFYTNQLALPRHQSVFLIGVSAGFVALVLGLALLTGSQRIYNHIKKWPWVTRFPRISRGIAAAHEHVRYSWQHRSQLIVPLLLLWALYPVRAMTLWICFLAFHSPVSLYVVWTGYSITMLISFLTFLPTTLGIFELTMVGTFSMLGISSELATAVALLYRLVTYWIPIPPGILSWWNLQRRAVR